MAGLSTGAPIVKVYHEKSMILPDVSRVLACLYEKDIHFTRHTASYKSLLRLQASSHAPVPFYDGLTFLEESREICRYIAETYEHQGYPFLLGKDSLERASIEQWLHHEEHAFNPPSRSLFCHLAFPLAEEDDDIEMQKGKLEEVLEVYEQRLGDSAFLAGNKFTLADLVHLPNSQYITDSDKYVYLYDSRKNVQRWWNAISSRDSWQKVRKVIQVVEQQRKQEELEKQQQRQWLREHPATTRRQIRLDSRKHTSTKSQTILVPPPVSIISTSPTASQAEKPLPTETSPDETLLSTPTAHKSSVVQHTTIFATQRETPPAPVQISPRLPGYSHIPVQSTSNSFTPATSPTTAENPSRTGADKSKIRGVSVPSEATEIQLPANSKRSSSKEVSNNLRVLDFYKANSHNDEAEPYIEPTSQKPSEILDRTSETDWASNATDHVKTSPISAKEDSGASGFWTDNTATNADTLDKKSVRYTEHTPQRPVEPIHGRYTDQRATYTSPGKHGSTEAHQKLQTEQWHGTAAGLSNLKGETDYLIPTQQVIPGKDVQHSSSQDSEQVSTHPLAQEPVSMDRQLVQGPEMTPRTPYTDQKRDVSSMLWRQTADARGIVEEDNTSSDHRDAVLPPDTRKHAEEAKIVSADHRKDASLPMRVEDEDTHDIAQEARETASAPRRRRAQDASDTPEGVGTDHSSSSRPQPINAPQDAAPPSKQAAPQGPRRVTTPYPVTQEFIKQARESPASRSTVPHDAQHSTEEETVESSSSKAHLFDSRLADALPPKKFLDEDGYGAIAPLQTGYADDPYNRKRDRDTAAPKRMMSQDAFEEIKMADSASSEAQALDDQHADAPPQKQRPAEDVQTTAAPLKERYSGGEDTTKKSKDAASKPRRMAAQEVQDNFKEAKAGDSFSTREPPSDTWRAPPLPRHQVDDDHSTTAPSQRRYPGTGDTIKEVEDITSMPRRMAGEDANETLEETKFAESASSEAQPLYYHRTDAPSRKQEAIEDRRGATSPLERRYADAEDITKHSTAFKPSKIVGQDAEDTSEEAEARNSALFRAQPQDVRRVATTPSKQAAEDALSGSRSPPKRYPRAEETSKQPRVAASKPTHIAAQDARDVFRESKAADSTPSIEQPSDARAAASSQKQEVPDAHNTSASFQKRYPDVKGATKKSKVTFEETKSPDSASSRLQPSDSQRDYVPYWKKEATEAPRANSPFKKRDSDVEDTAKHSDAAFKPGKMVGQDTEGTYEETKASDSGLLREQSSDTWQAATTPTEKVATEDGSGGTPPSERNAPNDEDTTTRARGTASARRRTTAGDASGAFQESKPADPVSSREQPLSSRQPVVTPSRQETEDSLSKISAFHKTRPSVEDITKPAVDTVFGPRQIGVEDTKDITEETKVAASASSVRARRTYTPRTARPLSEQAEVDEDAREKDREGRQIISAPKNMVSRDAQDIYGERKTPHSASTEQSLDNLQASSPIKQAAAEDPHGATRGDKESLVDEPKKPQGVKGTSKNSVGTFEETKAAGSTLPTAQPFSAQDAHHTDRSSGTPTADQRKDAPTQLQSNLQDTYEEAKSSSAHQKGLGLSLSQAEAGDDDQAIMGEFFFSSEKLGKMVKESQSISSKAQPTDSRSPSKAERPPSVYQEDHLVAPDSREKPRTLPTGVKADGSTPKNQQAPVVPSTSEEKPTPPTPPRAKVHEDHSTEEPFKRDTVDDPEGAPLLLGQEPTSRVQRATELTPDGDMSSKPSTIGQWQRTSAPIQGITPNSGDDVLGASTIDQKPTPMSQQSIPTARGANEMVKREQGMVPSAPAGAQTPDVQHAPPSFARADMAERDGEPVQMQAPTLHPRPTSVPTRRATPDDRDTGDKEFFNTSDAQRWKALKAKHDSAMINEDVRDASLSTHDATGDNKTTWHASEAQVSDTLPGSTATPVNVQPTSGDKLVERFSRDRGAKPPESTQAETPSDAPRDSVSTQGVPSDALDKTKISKPSSTEGMRPTAGPASTLEPQLAEHKFAPSDKRSARAAQPLSSVESRKEDTSVSGADRTKEPQTIFRQEARPSTPITKQVPSSNAYHDKRKIQQVTLDNLPTHDSSTPHVPSYEQVSHAPQTIPSERDMTPAPGTSDSPASNNQIASAKFQEAIPDNYGPDELTVPFVSNEKQGSYAGSYTEPHEEPSYDALGAADDKDITKYPSRQAPVLEYRPDSTPADSYVRPTGGDEPGISPDQGAESPTAAQVINSEDQRNEVFLPEKKFAPSDQGSVHSVQQPSPAETRKEEIIVAAAEQTLPRNIRQQHTQDMREAPTSDVVPAEDIPSDAQSGRPDEVALAEQKFASSDQDTQLTSSVEPRNEEIRNSTRSAQPLFSAADGQTKDPQTTIGQQDIAPTPGTSKSPSSDTHHASGQFQEVAPDDHHTVESLPNQGQVSRAKPSFVLSEGPTRDSHSDIDKKTTKLPSSQAQSSYPKPDPTQNHSDEPPTRFLPSQLPKQHAEAQALPPLVGPYDSKSSQDVTSDTLGKVKSPKPSSIDQEAMGSSLTPNAHLGNAPGEAALAGQKLLLKDQDSAHPTQKSSSSEPTKEQTTIAAPNEAKTSPTIFSQQDIAVAQTKMKDPSSGSQYVPQRLQEITPEDQRTTGSIPRQQQVPQFEHISKPHDGPTPDPHGAFVEEPIAHTTGPTPHAQYGMTPSGLSPDVEKFEISDEDSDHHAQLSSSAGSRKEEGDVDASDQTIMPAPGTSESSGELLEVGPVSHRSSELTRPLIPSRKQDSHDGHPESHEGPNPDAHQAVADENTAAPLVSQARSLESGFNSAPSIDDVVPTSVDEPVARRTNEHEKQIPAAFQASLPPEALYDSIYAKSVSADAFGEFGPLKATGEVTPADQTIAPSEPLPVVESRKESTGAEAEESKVYQPVTGQKDIRHAPGVSERVIDDDHNKEPVSREEQVSHDQRASEPREGSPADVRGASLDKKTTPPSSQAQSSDPKRDSLPKSVDVNPSSGQQSTTKILRGQGAQLPGLTRSPPLHESLLYPESNEDVPKSSKPPSPNQEVTSPKVVPASAPDTLHGTASDEIAPDGQNFPLSAQDLARSAQRPFSVESTKEKGIVASSDQTIEARTIIGQQGVTPTDKEKTPLDLQASELAKPPNEDQEQVHAGSAFEQREGPTRDARGAVDEKMPHPSSQAENPDIPPDSAPISVDAHRTSVDGPTTSSRDSEAQPPTGTQIVPAIFLERIESPTPPSTDQELMMPMTSLAPAPEARQDQDLTTTSQLSPSVASRKDAADQTNVVQAGLREPASSDYTRPSEKIQEFSPDAYLTKSDKSLLPMKGADPVQTPYEASLSSDEKTSMIKGDQTNTISNVSLSASQAVGQPGNSAVKGPLSEESVSSFSQKNLERTSPEEKPKQQEQQIDQSSTRSSKDDSIEARRTANPNILTRSGDIQQSPVKESTQEAQRSRNQQQADQAVFRSTRENEMQIEETVAQDNVSDDPEEIMPDSAPISGTSSDGPATSSLRDSLSQPPAGTLNVPAVFLEKIESPRRPSTDQELMAPMTSPAPAPDTPQDEDSTQSPQLSPSAVSRKDLADANQTDVPQAGLRVPRSSDATLPSEKIQEFSTDASRTKSAKPLLPMTDPVQPPHKASFGLSSDGKSTMIKGEQASTISNVSLSASQAVGQSVNSAVKRQLSEESVSLFSQKNLERTLPEEKSKQQQTDQPSTRPSNDDSIEASGTTNPNIKTTGDLQPSPLKESMDATEGSRNQEQADQAVFQSTQDNEKQIQETEAQDNGSDGPEEIRPDSSPISGDARRTSGDGPATRSLRDSQEQPPAGTLNAPVVFLEKMESPRPPSTDQELMTPKTSPAAAPDAPQDQDSTRSPQLSPSVVSRKVVANADQTNVSQAGLREPATSDVTRPSEKIQEFSPDTYLAKSEKPLLPTEGSNPVQTPNEASFGLSSNEKPTMLKGEQANTISNFSLSASQPAGQSEDISVKGPFSEDLVSSFSKKNPERTLPEEKSKQQQQTDQPSTRSSKDNSTKSSGTASPNILTTPGDLQPSPLKESMQAGQGSRNQQQPGQAVFQSMQDNEKQIEETEAQDNGSDEPNEIRPDSAPISGDDGPATSSLRDLQAQPPAGTLNVPAVFLENIESPRPPSADQEPMTPMTSPAPAPDAPQDQDSTQSPQLSPSVISRKDVANAGQTGLREPASSDATRPSEEIQEFSPDASLTKSAKPLLPMTGTNPVQPPHEAPLDLSSDGKPTMIKGDQANTISNVSLSASQPVGQSENSAVKGTLSGDFVSSFSKKNLERTLPEEKLKQQQRTDQSSTRSSKEDSIEASGIASPNILTTSGDIQPSPLKESMQAAQGSRNQQQADQAIFQSMQENEKQIEETDSQDNGSDEPKEIRPDSAPISGDARRTSDDGPATSSLRDLRAQPPAGTLNVPAVFLENIESPRPPSTDPEPMTSPAPAPDAPQDQDSTQSLQLSPSVISRKYVANADQTNVPQAGLKEPASSDATRPSEEIQEFSPDASLTKSAKPLVPMTGTNPVQTPHEASLDLSSDGKPTTIKGDQANTISNAGLSASEAVGQSKNTAVKGPLSEDLVSSFSQKGLEGKSPEEKSNQQQQTDQSNTRSSKDENTEASGTTNPDISSSRDIQPSPLKESAQAAEGSRNQQQADQAVFQSTLDSENQFVETEAQDVGPKELSETNIQRSMNQNNNGPSQRDVLEQPGELVLAKDAPGSIQEDSKSDSSSRTSEESEHQAQTEGKTQGGESKAPASEIEMPGERDRPSSNKSMTNQSEAETSDKLEEQTSSGTRSRDTDYGKLDGSTDDRKSADTDDKPPSS